jgi:hypothetical protein
MGQVLNIGVRLIVLAGTIHCAHAASLRAGDYLEDDFIAALSATKSPYRALRDMVLGLPQAIKVGPQGNAIRFVANLNWHEGWTMFILTGDGKQLPGEAAGDVPLLKIESNGHFGLKTPGREPWHFYTWVGDADSAVARLVLVGRYEDRTGHVVEFGADGDVRGLGADARFWLDNDHVVGNHFDYFYFGNDTAHPDSFAFTQTGRILRMYPLIKPTDPDDPSIGFPDMAHPSYTLTRKDADVGNSAAPSAPAKK